MIPVIYVSEKAEKLVNPWLAFSAVPAVLKAKGAPIVPEEREAVE